MNIVSNPFTSRHILFSGFLRREKGEPSNMEELVRRYQGRTLENSEWSRVATYVMQEKIDLASVDWQWSCDEVGKQIVIDYVRSVIRTRFRTTDEKVAVVGAMLETAFVQPPVQLELQVTY